jgi:type III secretion protein C
MMKYVNIAQQSERILNSATLKKTAVIVQGIRYLILIGVLGFAAQVVASEIEWKKEISALKYTDRPITEVLLGILTANNIEAYVSENVKGTVSVRIGAKDSQRVFENLSRTSGLVWFYDGQVVSVVPASEQVTRIVSIVPTTFDAVKAAIDASGLRSRRFTIKYMPESASFTIVGPNRYVNLVEEVIRGAVRRLGKNITDKNDPSKTVTQVFRLNHAWADDLIVNSDSGNSKVHGVATVLKGIFGKSSSSNSISAINSLAGDGPRNGVESKTLDAEGNFVNSTDSSFPSMRSGNPFESTRLTDSMVPGPRIAADPRTNSVIITDEFSRMKQYEQVINALDVKSSIVEIEVAIVEVEAGRSSELGIDWEFTRNRSNGASSTTNSSGRLAYGAGQLMMRLSKNGLDSFMANLNLLSNDGKARIIQRPRVITVDNFEATIGATEKAFVRVAGRDAVALYPVSTGLVLRVRPRVLGELNESGQPNSLMLQVNIEDGRNTGAQVDGIPTQKRNIISTQAIVKPLESIVLGGQLVESENDSESGVPVLKDIPFFGNAFKSTSTNRKTVERLFIISPRLINQSLETLSRRELPGLGTGVLTTIPSNPEKIRAAPILEGGTEPSRAK